MKKIVLFPLLLILASVSVIAIGNFRVQYPFGTDVFNVSSAGNVDASGWIKEKNTLLNATYYVKTAIDTQGEMEAIWSVALATDSEVTAANTSMKGYVDSQDTIYNTSMVTYVGATNTTMKSYVDTQDSAQDECSEITNCVANAWDSLTDMVLADGSIYIGNAATDPVANAITGDITLSNTGVVAVVNTAGLDYHNATTSVPTCAAAQALRFDGTDLSCISTGGADVYVNETGDTMTGTLTMDTGTNITVSATSQIGKAAGSYLKVDASGNVLIVLI